MLHQTPLMESAPTHWICSMSLKASCTCIGALRCHPALPFTFSEMLLTDMGCLMSKVCSYIVTHQTSTVNTHPFLQAMAYKVWYVGSIIAYHFWRSSLDDQVHIYSWINKGQSLAQAQSWSQIHSSGAIGKTLTAVLSCPGSVSLNNMSIDAALQSFSG